MTTRGPGVLRQPARYLKAVNAATGEALWTFDVGTGILQSPITYMAGKSNWRSSPAGQGPALLLQQDRPARDRCQPGGGVLVVFECPERPRRRRSPLAAGHGPPFRLNSGSNTEVLARKFRGAAVCTFVVSAVLLLAQMQARADEAPNQPTNPTPPTAVVPEARACSISTAPVPWPRRRAG